MRHPGRSLYGDAPQVHAVDRRHVLVHERRFGHQPEQPRLQARPPTPRCAGTGMQNRFGQPHLVARAYRSVFAGHGTLRPRYRQQRMAILLSRGARLVPLRDSRHYPEGRGNAARHREMACTRRPPAPSASNGPGLLRSVLPYTMGRVFRARITLEELSGRFDADTQEITWNGLRLKEKSVKQGIEWYRLALDRYLGEQLIRQLEAHEGMPSDGLCEVLHPRAACSDRWGDIGGMLAPISEINDITRIIATGQLDRIEKLRERLRLIHDRYDDFAWAWTWNLLHEIYPRFLWQGLYPVALPARHPEMGNRRHDTQPADHSRCHKGHLDRFPCRFSVSTAVRKPPWTTRWPSGAPYNNAVSSKSWKSNKRKSKKRPDTGCIN